MNVFLVGQPFAPYSTSHWIVLALLTVGAIWLVMLGRRHRGTEDAIRFRRRFAIFILVTQVPLKAMHMVPPYWNIAQSLPFHLCDIAWMVTAYALWTCRPWAFALTYYWGLSLTIQALFTPGLQFAFPHVTFFLFWGGHGSAVLAAIYLTWGLGLRPDWWTYRFAYAATLTWMFLMLVFNFAAGTNYGFLNAKPAGKSILDLLGDWPWYVIIETALVAVLWALMTWPWVRVDGKSTPDKRIMSAYGRTKL